MQEPEGNPSGGVSAEITVPLAPEHAFARFVALGDWWPKVYTWSGEALARLQMDARTDGLLTEYGPLGFRCDFGRVLAIERPRQLVFSWQISGTRAPQPDPKMASEVELVFTPEAGGATRVRLVHRHFERHGGDHAAYREAMGSAQGWPYLLRAFAQAGA